MDRVELAYLRHLPSCSELIFGIARTPLGYVLLDQAGLEQITQRVEGTKSWGRADGLSRLTRRKPGPVRQAESDLRRFALDRCRPGRLGAMLERYLPERTAYLNVGHSNLTDRMLWAVRHAINGRIAVLIHDTIPLDFPQYQRPGTPEKFRAMLKRVRSGADVLIFNSHHTRARVANHMHGWGPVPQSVVAHLGIDPVRPDPSGVPADLGSGRPYFVALGTIEPRKGHDLLLDVWGAIQTDMGPQTPQLIICGARGWNNDAVFERLDRLPAGGPVHELSGLADGAVAALLTGSHGLLFPSRAEGYGLPPVEAAALDVPVVCSDLPVIREVLGDIPVYARETDRYQWRNIIESLAKGRTTNRPSNVEGDFVPPTWDDHFNTVLRIT